jgi:hypothetical protein
MSRKVKSGEANKYNLKSQYSIKFHDIMRMFAEGGVAVDVHTCDRIERAVFAVRREKASRDGRTCRQDQPLSRRRSRACDTRPGMYCIENATPVLYGFPMGIENVHVNGGVTRLCKGRKGRRFTERTSPFSSQHSLFHTFSPSMPLR